MPIVGPTRTQTETTATSQSKAPLGYTVQYSTVQHRERERRDDVSFAFFYYIFVLVVPFGFSRVSQHTPPSLNYHHHHHPQWKAIDSVKTQGKLRTRKRRKEEAPKLQPVPQRVVRVREGAESKARKEDNR